MCHTNMNPRVIDIHQTCLFLNVHYLLLVGLQQAFKTFGSIKVEWPGKDGKHPRYSPKGNGFFVNFTLFVVSELRQFNFEFQKSNTNTSVFSEVQALQQRTNY